MKHTYAVMTREGAYMDVDADAISIVGGRVEFYRGAEQLGVVYDPEFVFQKVDLP